MYQVEELSESVAHGSLTSTMYCMYLTTTSSTITLLVFKSTELPYTHKLRKSAKTQTICWRTDILELCLELNYAKITALGLE